jgi:predicted transcriptional regulator
MEDRIIVSFRADRRRLHELAGRRGLTPSALLRQLIDQEVRRQQRAEMKNADAGTIRQDQTRAGANLQTANL